MQSERERILTVPEEMGRRRVAYGHRQRMGVAP